MSRGEEFGLCANSKVDFTSPRGSCFTSTSKRSPNLGPESASSTLATDYRSLTMEIMWTPRFVCSPLSLQLAFCMPKVRGCPPSPDLPSELFIFRDETILRYCRAYSTTIVTAGCNSKRCSKSQLTTPSYKSSCLLSCISKYMHHLLPPVFIALSFVFNMKPSLDREEFSRTCVNPHKRLTTPPPVSPRKTKKAQSSPSGRSKDCTHPCSICDNPDASSKSESDKSGTSKSSGKTGSSSPKRSQSPPPGPDRKSVV